MLAVVAGGLLVLVMLVGLLIASISDLFAGDVPREDDPQVMAARDEAARVLDADMDRLAVAVVAPSLSSPGTVSHGQDAPPCTVGQHNFKIDDDFDLACGLRRSEVVTVADRRTFRADMVALDAALRADGWVPSPTFDMDRVLVDYWDALATPPDAPASPEPGTDPDAATTRSYSMDDLPSAGYSKTVDGKVRGLAVSWAERDSVTMVLTYDEQRAVFTEASGREISTADVLGTIPAEGYAVVVTESVEYFRQ